jgi:Phosphotransferase enzyme family
MIDRYKDFPPGWGHILVPVGSRAEARAGIAMYTPGSRKGELAQSAAWLAVSIGGTRLLPGRAVPWASAVPDAVVAALHAAVEAAVGAFDAHVVYERREGRAGLILLASRRGAPLAFVKALRDQPDRIAAESDALRLVEASPLLGVSVPNLLGAGDAGQTWRYVITTPLPARMHRTPKESPDPALLKGIRDALSGLARPPGTPGHWEPAHGDFTPWNLRRFRDGSMFLVDWEEAGWAPPGADLVLYRASSSAIGRPIQGGIDRGEARDYWVERLRSRVGQHLAAGQGLSDLERGMLSALSEEAA